MVGKCTVEYREGKTEKKKRIVLPRIFYTREEEIGSSLRASREEAERSRKAEHGREAFLESTQTDQSAVECFHDRRRFSFGTRFDAYELKRIMRIRSAFVFVPS